MKYIIVRSQGHESAILFPEHVSHSSAVNRGELKPISAGFCHVRVDSFDVEVMGGSQSLELKSRPEDAEIIEITIGMMGLPTSNRGMLGAVGIYMGPYPEEAA